MKCWLKFSTVFSQQRLKNGASYSSWLFLFYFFCPLYRDTFWVIFLVLQLLNLIMQPQNATRTKPNQKGEFWSCYVFQSKCFNQIIPGNRNTEFKELSCDFENNEALKCYCHFLKVFYTVLHSAVLFWSLTLILILKDSCSYLSFMTEMDK